VSKASHIGLIAQGGAGWAGGSEYIHNLLRAIGAAEPGRRVTIFCGEPQAAEWKSRLEAGANLVAVPVRRKRSLLDRLWSRGGALDAAIRQAGVDFLYPLTYDNQYNIGIDIPSTGTLGGAAWAGWIPDFQHRFLPHLFSAKEIQKRDRGIVQLVASAPRVVMSSQSAAEDLRRFHPEAAGKEAVLTFSTFPREEWFSPGVLDLGWLPERFFLVSNQFWKHKNHLLLFDALALLASRGVRPTVVCTGQLADFRDADYTNVILQTLHKKGIASQVLLLGMVPRIEQIQMMRRCLAVIQPSRFEGWSTVVEDSRVLGKSCLLSDIPVHREQNPPGARFFSPDDAEGLANLIADAWTNLPPGPDLAAEQAAREQANARIVEVGRTFLAIADETLSKGGAA
jgi:glycosyltransferase involved in cell wall biosynthesis